LTNLSLSAIKHAEKFAVSKPSSKPVIIKLKLSDDFFSCKRLVYWHADVLRATYAKMAILTLSTTQLDLVHHLTGKFDVKPYLIMHYRLVFASERDFERIPSGFQLSARICADSRLEIWKVKNSEPWLKTSSINL
jgi:hypothetical protein